jgi:hypothetical protein
MISLFDMIRLVERFRKMCLARFPDDVDPVSIEERDKRIGLAIASEPRDWLHVGRAAEPIEAICRLAKTPRLLKLILRNTYKTWESLHGELDFDDILVANVLRFAAPGSFEFLLENSAEVRGLQYDGFSKDREARLTALDSKWSKSADKASWDTTTAKSLAQFLFPCWKILSAGMDTSFPQGVLISVPTDYWSRLLTGKIDELEIRDQDVIRAMSEWKKGPEGQHYREMNLAEVLCENHVFAERFEHFAKRILTGREIRSIATQLFSWALASKRMMANQASVAAFIPLWRLALQKPLEEVEHAEWVSGEINKALPISLQLANDIFYYWGSNSESDVEMKRRSPSVRTAMVNRAIQLFANNPQALIAAINPAFIYTTYHFCVLHSGEDNPVVNPGNWAWFFELLVRAAEVDRQTMVPQISCFIVNEQRGFNEFHYTINEKYVEMFGTHTGRLMRILAEEINTEHLDAREIKRIQVLGENALKWLGEHPAND